MSTSMTSIRGTERSAHCLWAKRPVAYGAVAPFAGIGRRNDLTVGTRGATQPGAGEGMT